MSIQDRDLFTRLIRCRPLFTASLLFMTGCILGCRIAPPVGALWVAFLVLLIVAALCLGSRRRIAAVFVLLCMLPAGGIRFHYAWLETAPIPEHKEALLSGRICQNPVWDAEDERAICVLEDLCVDGEAQEGRLRLYLRGDPALLQAVTLGQRVECSAHIWRADESTNPGQFNFSNYLRINGLRGYATAAIENTELSAPAYRFSDFPARFSILVGQRIDRLFPHNSALARAFVMGDRSGLSDEERVSYSKSGAAHLLAISGMHVSVLATAISMVLGRFLERKHAFCITLALLLVYGSILGFSASLFRAILMFTVFTSAPLVGRYSDSPTRLAAAMFVYLLIRPTAILESSFILSYGASAGIIFLYEPLCRLFGVQRYIRKHTGVGFLSLFTHRLPRWILQSLLATLAAEIAILPAVVHAFGAQPVWSFFVNLIAVPLAMAAYILALTATICAIPIIAQASDMLFGLLTTSVSFFSELPLSTLHIARFPAWLCLLCAISCFLSSDLSRLPFKIRRFLPFFVILAIFISNGCAQLTLRGCSLVFMDAGQANCSVLRTEGKVYLFDTGDAYSPAADYLSMMNYDVEGIFLTHNHTDHAGGLDEILNVTTPKRVYVSVNWNDPPPDASVSTALERAAAQGSEIIFLSAGDAIALSNETFLEVLWPTAGFQGDSANQDSLLLRVNYGDTCMLFTGDLPTSVYSGEIGDIDLLQVAHHGARDGTNSQLLLETTPSVALVPVGYNTYGHPNGQTLKLLEAAGAQVYRTDRCGAITCRLDKTGGIYVRTYLSSEDINEVE